MIQDHELVKGDKEVKLNLISREKAKQWTENTHIAKKIIEGERRIANHEQKAKKFRERGSRNSMWQWLQIKHTLVAPIKVITLDTG